MVRVSVLNLSPATFPRCLRASSLFFQTQQFLIYFIPSSDRSERPGKEEPCGTKIVQCHSLDRWSLNYLHTQGASASLLYRFGDCFSESCLCFINLVLAHGLNGSCSFAQRNYRVTTRLFGVAFRGVFHSKTPAYFGLECGVIWYITLPSPEGLRV